MNKTTKTKPLLIDLDSIVVSMIEPWLNKYNEKCDTDVTVDDIISYDMGLFCKNTEVFYSILKEPGFFYNMDPMPGAVEGMRALIADGYDIIILTRPPDESSHGVADKQAWIRERFPSLASMKHQIFTTRKELIDGALLFDDCPDHLIQWKERHPGGIAATLDWKYNRYPEVDKVVSFRGSLDASGWSDFVDFVREVLPLK